MKSKGGGFRRWSATFPDPCCSFGTACRPRRQTHTRIHGRARPAFECCAIKLHLRFLAPIGLQKVEGKFSSSCRSRRQMSAIITCEFSQNKAIWGYPLTKLAHIIPGGGASFVIFANDPATNCRTIVYKSENPPETLSPCHKVVTSPIHLLQVGLANQPVWARQTSRSRRPFIPVVTSRPDLR